MWTVFMTPEDLKTELELSALNPRQRAFVSEYLLDLNATQAAIRAGYSPDTAGSQAFDLLKKPEIASAVERGKAHRLARVNMTADTVLNELAALARSRVDHYALDDFGNLKLADGAPEDAMAAVKSVKKRIRHDKDGSVTYDVSFELWDKPGQLKIMGKHVGVKACSERMEVTGPDGGPIPIQQVSSVIVDPKAGE